MRLRTRALSYWTRLGRTWRRFRTRAVRVMVKNSEPRMVALGVAIGVFVAVLPAIGFQLILAILIATALGANKLAAAASVWVANPLFFYVDYLIGRRLLDALGVTTEGTAALGWRDVAGQATRNLLLPLLAGSVIFGLLCAVLTYFVSVNVVTYYRQRAAQRRTARSGQAGGSGEQA